MTYEEICECNKVDVLKHFIRVESQKCDYKDEREEMITWISLPDQAFIDKVRNFEKQRTDENPAILWTIGTAKDSSRLSLVKGWVLVKVNLGSLYTCGMNREVNVHLNLPDVKGNLKCFVDRGYVSKHPEEFHTDRNPMDGALRVLIGVTRRTHQEKERNGEIEIVDGCHRAVGMLQNGEKYAQAYIAKLRRIG